MLVGGLLVSNTHNLPRYQVAEEGCGYIEELCENSTSGCKFCEIIIILKKERQLFFFSFFLPEQQRTEEQVRKKGDGFP